MATISTRRRALAGFAGFGLVAVLTVAVPTAASADTFDVLNDADAGAGSLRAAVEAANDNPGPDTITFASGVETIELERAIEITGPLTIEGPGSGELTIGRADTDEFDQFEVDTSGDVTFSGMTITGTPGGNGRGIWVLEVGSLLLDDVAIVDQHYRTDDEEGTGAAVRMEDAVTGDVTLRDSRFDGNTADLTSAVDIIDVSSGTLRVERSTFEHNLAMDEYGALFVGVGGIVEIVDSVFTDNIGVDDWGSGAVVLYDIGQLSVTGSTFTGNVMGDDEEGAGGGIHVWDVYDYSWDGETRPGNGDVTISDSVFTGNTAGGSGGAVYIHDVAGTVTISDSVFTDNDALEDWGGGVEIERIHGGLLLERSTFEGNSAREGAGFNVYELGVEGEAVSAQIVDSSFVGNDADDSGAGVQIDYVYGELEISGSTFAGNQVGDLGASFMSFWLDGRVGFTNSTFDEPEVAIYVDNGEQDGVVSVEHSTAVAPGLAELPEHDLEVRHTAVDSLGEPVASVDGTVTIAWSALTDSPTAADFDELVTEGDNQFGVADLGLTPLADNGGFTQTMLPDAASPLIDAGDPAIADAPATDQRGENRIVGTIDIGAVEFQPAPPDVLTPTWVVTPEGPLVADGSSAYTATVSVVNQDDDPVPGIEVQFTVPTGLTASETECTTGADGTCSITLTSTVAGTYEVTASTGDDQIGDPVPLEFVAGPASVATSTIEADPTTITAGGETSTVTVRLFDANGNPLPASGGDVTIVTDLGEISSTADHGDGTYTATLTSDAAGIATLSFTIGGELADDTATVAVTGDGDGNADGDGNGDDDGNGDGGGDDAGLAETGTTPFIALLAVTLLVASGAALLVARRMRRAES